MFHQKILQYIPQTVLVAALAVTGTKNASTTSISNISDNTFPIRRKSTQQISPQELHRWASDAENLRIAMEKHRKYFKRTRNPNQEKLIEFLRIHYNDVNINKSDVPLEAFHYRFDDQGTYFWKICRNTKVNRIPELIHGVIDENREKCIVDFANKYLGGGFLSYGMAQEEKMILERFDYAMWLAKEAPHNIFQMDKHETWVLRHGHRWSHLDFYGWTPKNWKEQTKLLTPTDDIMTTPTIVAIDALKANFLKYEQVHIETMLRKAFLGFSAVRYDQEHGFDRIATGNWGCGAFKNNQNVMFVIQSLAANLAGVSLGYYMAPKSKSVSLGYAFLENAMLQEYTVAETLEKLVDTCANAKSKDTWLTSYDPNRTSWTKKYQKSTL